jgi:hypothetical protein
MNPSDPKIVRIVQPYTERALPFRTWIKGLVGFQAGQEKGLSSLQRLVEFLLQARSFSGPVT